MSDDSSLLTQFRIGFSNRLLSILTEQGYKNERKPYYVDIVRFANELELNPTMIRRYLNASAAPRTDIVEKMAKILQVDPLWLYTGYKTLNRLDKKLLQEILNQVLNGKVSKTVLQSSIEQICDIYEHVNEIEHKDEVELKRVITWIIKGLKENSTKSRFNTKEKLKK